MKTLERISFNWMMALAMVVSVVTATVAHAQRTETFAVYTPADEPGMRVARTYFVADGASEDDMMLFRERLMEAGARAVNWFLPDNIIVCELPQTKNISDVLATAPPVKRLEQGALGPSFAPGGRTHYIERSYQMAAQLPSVSAADAGLAPEADADGFGCALVVPTEDDIRATERELAVWRASNPEALSRSTATTAREQNQNSEFMGGNILAQFVFPESNGFSEPSVNDWSDEDLADAVSAATAFMLDYQGQFTAMKINIIFRYYERARCNYEAIKHNMDDDFLWTMDVIKKIDPELSGINNLEALVHEFNSKNRIRRGTQWAFTTFIANSRSQPNFRFEGSDYTAYAILGGPYNVNPYPAGTDPNRIGIQLMSSKIFQHETGHTFWTLDEYEGAPGFCGDRSGYLAYENGNVWASGPSGFIRCNPEVDCIMNRAAREIVGHPFCRWSQGHLGVIDDNDNAIPDLYEGEPIVEFAVAGPETVLSREYSLDFRARSTAVPNNNPHQSPENRINYAVRLRDAWVSIGGSTLVPLDPLDGAWDEHEEDLRFDIQLSVGETRLYVQARTDVGYKSRWYEKRIYFAGVNYAEMSAHAQNNSIEVTWFVAGEDFNATYDLYRFPVGKRSESVLIAAGVEPSGSGTSGFVPYAFTDWNVDPGQDYGYYVRGKFLLDVGGDQREFEVDSRAVSTTAMIPIIGTNILSVGAPNPFRNNVTVSLRVPETFETNEYTTGSGITGLFQQRVATPVDVAVFDVRGRLVKTLRRSGEFFDVVTVRWDGTNQSNVPVSSGVYFIKANAGELIGIRKVLLIR